VILSLESVKALFSHFTLKSLQGIAVLQKIYLIKWNSNKTKAFSCNKSLEVIEVLETIYKSAKIPKLHMSKGHSN
jgi:hypothetical protein